MRNLLKFLLSLAAASLLMLAFRALVFTIYSINGEGLEPEFMAGDRVLVNRWSYGLRMGGRGLFAYDRICKQPINRGDIVAYENPCEGHQQRVLFGRIKALPGDTVRYLGGTELVPSIQDCATADYYWIEALGKDNPLDSRQLGMISEQLIIGRACLLLFSHEPGKAFWEGYRKNRFLIVQ